jgi:lipopolysaccharide cholinephosphotransferase
MSKELMNEELAAKNLRPLKEVFDKFGIKFWLDHGALLGAVRDGKIIEWDDDIGLSMCSEDRDKLFLALNEPKEENSK